jgi:hypothetical protein
MSEYYFKIDIIGTNLRGYSGRIYLNYVEKQQPTLWGRSIG